MHPQFMCLLIVDTLIDNFKLEPKQIMTTYLDLEKALNSGLWYLAGAADDDIIIRSLTSHESLFGLCCIPLLDS